MSKLSGLPPAVPSPVTTAGGSPTVTFEGGAATTRDVRSELFLLAVTNMVSEDTFYECGESRDVRFRSLIHGATALDPDWVARFVPYLRNEMHMRSASIVLAAESAWYRLQPGMHACEGVCSCSAPTVRELVASAISRLDEPGEFIGYWRSRYGRTLPAPVKRGIADAFVRLCNERSAIKYDGQRNAYRLGDVIEIVHPKPSAPWQSDLFGWLLDRRRHAGHDLSVSELLLPTVWSFEVLADMARDNPDDARTWLLEDPDRLRRAGLTWEYLSGLGPMDAAAWEAVIPSMGYMALLRNLRNFDQAGISDRTAAGHVTAKLISADEVARSRQFPYRFLSAYRATESVRWAPALERALQLSCQNVPELPGRTLVLFDTSASMQQAVSARSKVRHLDVAALFATVTALRNPGRVDLVGFADGAFGFDAGHGGASVLRAMDKIDALVGSVGHGTNMLGALQATYRGHDRVVVFSDLQCAPYLGVGSARAPGYGWGSHHVPPPQIRLEQLVPASTQVIAVNTSGYAATPVDSSLPNYHELGGFSDRIFTLMGLLGSGRGSGWPF